MLRSDHRPKSRLLELESWTSNNLGRTHSKARWLQHIDWLVVEDGQKKRLAPSYKVAREHSTRPRTSMDAALWQATRLYITMAVPFRALTRKRCRRCTRYITMRYIELTTPMSNFTSILTCLTAEIGVLAVLLWTNSFTGNWTALMWCDNSCLSKGKLRRL